MKKINSICIIDDDAITVFGMRKILDVVVDYNSISTFSNGKLAIDGIKKILANEDEIPEIIFLDINMPIMDGWQFLEEFISLPIKQIVKINILTSSIDTVDKQNWEGYRNRTQHVITYNRKPIRREDIVLITRVA